MPKNVTARAQIRTTVRERIDGAEEISIPQVTSTVLSALLDDKKFLHAFTNETLRDAVHREVLSVVGSSRDLTQFGDTALTERGLERRAAAFARRFLGWYEHVGDRHLNLMKMHDGELRLAATTRFQSAATDNTLGTLWVQLADGLEGGQAVEDRFTAEEIEALYYSIRDAQQSEGAA